MICKREKAHFRLTCIAQKRLCLSPLMMTGITSGAGRTPLCAAEKVWFSRFCVLIRVYNFTIKHLEQGVFLDWSLSKSVKTCDERSTFAIPIFFS